MQTPKVWADTKLASELGQKAKELKENISKFKKWEEIIADAEVAFEMKDEDLRSEAEQNLEVLETHHNERVANIFSINEQFAYMFL